MKLDDNKLADITIIIILSPLVYMLEQPTHTSGINISFLIILGITCFSSYIAIWILISVIQKMIPFLNLAGLLVCITSLFLWLFLREAIALYLLGIAIVFLHFLLTHQQNDEINENKIANPYLYSQIIVLMGLCIGFLISIYFWDDRLIYGFIAIEISFMLLNLYQFLKLKREKSSTHDTNYNILLKKDVRSNLKLFLLIMVSGLIPIGLAAFLSILFYGYLIFLPFNFTTGKLIIAFSLILLIFLLIRRK